LDWLQIGGPSILALIFSWVLSHYWLGEKKHSLACVCSPSPFWASTLRGMNEGDVSLCSRKQKERKRPPRSVPLVLSLPLSKNGVMTQSDVPSVVRLW